MKIILAYVAATPHLAKRYDDIALSAPEDITIKTFNLALPGKHKRANWTLLNNLWKSKDKNLISLYNKFINAAADCDSLLNLNGWNLHPKILKHLNTYNIYSFYDDPESSNNQSKHIAPYYDAVLYGNIASKPQYKSWGCNKTAWIPIPLVHLADQTIPKNTILDSYKTPRTNDAILCCGYNDWRTLRLNKIGKAFPNAKYFGHGWNSGWIQDQDLYKLYLNTKIGWNIHNSTGPINHRLYTLPAYGILQLCDNKYSFGQIYKLNQEAIGFNTIQEAIDLTHHYLKNPDQAQKIALAGYARYQKDYTPQAVWQTLINQIKQWTTPKQNPTSHTPNIITTNLLQKISSTPSYKIRKTIDKIKTTIKPQKWKIDESIYLNNPTNQHNDFTAQSPNTHANPNDPNHQQAAHRAITHLIDNAKNITLANPQLPHLKTLLAVDPNININTQNTPDLYINPNPIIIKTSQNISELKQILKEASPSPRIILNIYTASPPSPLPKLADLLKEQFTNIRHYTLKDPHVPLLSPISPNAKTHHRIIHCY